jgi:hypothetical protein
MSGWLQISMFGDDCAVRPSRSSRRHFGSFRRPGRPSSRPPDIDPGDWEGYIRAMRRRREGDPSCPLPDFRTWSAEVAGPREYGRRGGLARRETGIYAQTIEWVTIIHRRDMIRDPSIERDWHRRLYLNPELGRTHRIHLRGVQRREVRGEAPTPPRGHGSPLAGGDLCGLPHRLPIREKNPEKGG